MKFDKKNLMPSIVLSVICIVIAGLMAVVNMFTAPRIEEEKKEAISESLRVVMPSGTFGESESIKGKPETVTGIYKDENGGGHVVTLSTNKGYTGKPITITVAIDNSGKIIKAIITDSQETKGKDLVASFTEGFAGIEADKVAGTELISGVTYSSRAVRNAINDALFALGYVKETVEEEEVGVDTGRSDSEVRALAYELINGADLEEVKLENAPVTVKKIYKEVEGKGYVFYIATAGWGGTVATEGLVATDALGTITGIKMLKWTVGHGVNYTEEFLNGFVGKNKEQLARVELVAQATGTSSDFHGAVYDALAVVFPAQTYTVITLIVIGVAAVLLAAAYFVSKRRKRA